MTADHLFALFPLCHISDKPYPLFNAPFNRQHTDQRINGCSLE
nr:MAG TPA_asm: hypothetical protein [Caudoviricetes sp.]